MRSFFRELQRRNVYRAGAAYAVVGWLVVQIATQVLPIFDVSPLALRVIVLLIVAGFPIVLVLAWVYEVTPARHRQNRRRRARRIDHAPHRPATQCRHHRHARGRGAVPRRAALSLSAEGGGDRRPRSRTSRSRYCRSRIFPRTRRTRSSREGIQDEILTRLAKIGALKVISRTSTQHYASSPDNLPEIARQLGVANILEGSVQKSRRRGAHQRAADPCRERRSSVGRDLQPQARRYLRRRRRSRGCDRAALKAKLSGAEKAAVADKPTQNAAAFEAYLRGRALDDCGLRLRGRRARKPMRTRKPCG